MGFPVIPVIAAGAQFIGSQVSNAQNAAMAREQMDFQREMSNTAYQRAVRDMRAAGLNPALAYQQGGASSPAGARSEFQNVGAASVSGVTSGLDVMNRAAELKQKRADVEQREAVTKFTNMQTYQLGVESWMRLQKLAEEAYSARYSGWSAKARANLDSLQYDILNALQGANIEAGRLEPERIRAGIRETNARAALSEFAAPRSRAYSLPFEALLNPSATAAQIKEYFGRFRERMGY